MRLAGACGGFRPRLVGGRFPVGPLRGRDVKVFLVGVVPGILDDGLARCLELGDERGACGFAGPAVTQELCDVQELVGFVRQH